VAHVRRRKNAAAITETHPLASVPEITVQMEWDEETEAWVTHVPELNNISTFGKTQEEALRRTRELVLGYIDTMQDLHLRVPLPASAVRRLREALA
jgi:predicted RNase H-like HicB family nuclease